jgi:hypothetical protein
MKPRKMDIDELRKYFRYDSDTGILYWNLNNSVAGSFGVNNYRKVRLHGVYYQVHRIAYALYHNSLSDKIDHINGIKHDNRICNLREADDSQNNANSKIASNNKSGVTGVSWNPKSNKWESKIKVKGTTIHLGYFESLESAAITRRNAELWHFGDFAPPENELLKTIYER